MRIHSILLIGLSVCTAAQEEIEIKNGYKKGQKFSVTVKFGGSGDTAYELCKMDGKFTVKLDVEITDASDKELKCKQKVVEFSGSGNLKGSDKKIPFAIEFKDGKFAKLEAGEMNDAIESYFTSEYSVREHGFFDGSVEDEKLGQYPRFLEMFSVFPGLPAKIGKVKRGEKFRVDIFESEFADVMKMGDKTAYLLKGVGKEHKDDPEIKFIQMIETAGWVGGLTLIIGDEKKPDVFIDVLIGQKS